MIDFDIIEYILSIKNSILIIFMNIDYYNVEITSLVLHILLIFMH